LAIKELDKIRKREIFLRDLNKKRESNSDT